MACSTEGQLRAQQKVNGTCSETEPARRLGGIHVHMNLRLVKQLMGHQILGAQLILYHSHFLQHVVF